MEPAFTSARHLSLSLARSIQSMPSSHFLRPSFTLSSHLRLVLPSSLFPVAFPTPSKPLPIIYMLCPSRSSRFHHSNNILWGLQIIKLLIMKFPPLPCHLVPLKPKYSSQHPILKHPQPTFLTQCQRPSFTPIKNNRQNYNFVYFKLYIFG